MNPEQAEQHRPPAPEQTLHLWEKVHTNASAPVTHRCGHCGVTRVQRRHTTTSLLLGGQVCWAAFPPRCTDPQTQEAERAQQETEHYCPVCSGADWDELGLASVPNFDCPACQARGHFP